MANNAGDIPNVSSVWQSSYTIAPGNPVGAMINMDADGNLKCKGLKVGDVDIKTMVEQLSTMIPIFVPPDVTEDRVMENAAVKMAYDQYMDARKKLVITRDQLDFLIRLARENKL